MILLLPALAAAKTGKDLQEECSVAVKVFSNQTVSGEADYVRIGNCFGFVTGVMQAAALGKAGPGNRPAKDPQKDFCVSPDLSLEQVVRASLQRLKTNPEELDLDAAAVVLRALNQAFPPATCIGSPGKQAEGLHWPNFPKKAHMRVRVVAVALAEPRSSYFSSREVLVAEKEIGDEEFSLIKLIFAYLPYQPRLSESGFDYSVVHEVLAWRNIDCDETIEQLTTRSLPDRHEPLIYAPNVPRLDLDLRRIPLPCYETKADDYLKSSREPMTPPANPSAPVLKARPEQVRPDPAATPSDPVVKASPSPTPTPTGPVLKTRPPPE